MGTKMFKIGSFEEELCSSMKKSLASNQLEAKYNFDKIAKAADYIGNAAELLDNNGFAIEAEMLTKVLKRLAKEDEKCNCEGCCNGSECIMILNKKDDSKDNSDAKDYDEVILEPLEQEIEMPMFDSPRETAPKNIFEKPEMWEFEAIANKLAAKLAKKKV